jgi:mono/diheme cytochrome c family protein
MRLSKYCMQLGYIIFLVLLLSGHYLDEGSLKGQNLPKTSPPALPAKKVREVKAIYKQNCVKCHGVDGRAQTAEGEIAGAQDFTNLDWQERVSEQRVINSIAHGRGQMPAFKKKLNEQQIKSLAAFVLTFK